MEVAVLGWGIVEIRVTTADPNGFLSALTENNIAVSNVIFLDELSLRLRVREKDLRAVKGIGVKRADEIEVVACFGISFLCRQMLSRPVLLSGVLIMLFLILYLPGRILFVQVEGNHRIPERLIAEKAEKCGLVFGTKTRYIRSESVKNALLSEIPELQWACVNTRGCLAVISVRERSVAETNTAEPTVGHIVAARDGVISGLTVTKGTPLCAVGQAVTKGQVLVSGYTDCGFVTRAEAASAEVIAVTERQLTGRLLSKYTCRGQITDTKVDYSIQIGKNIVQLSNSSGIPDGSCVKIYKRTFLTLPGGFQLPIGLIRQKRVFYDSLDAEIMMEPEETESLLDRLLREQMLSGQILSAQYLRLPNADSGIKGIYICEEMIGKLRKEEIGKENG